MGLTHYSILNRHPQVQFVAICDSSSFVLKNVGRRLGVAGYRDADKMFREVKPDFAIVATPTGLHAEVVECAIANDAHVFVEKPYALTPEQGAGLLQRLQGKTLVHQVGYAMRFQDIFMKVKRLLDLGAFGEITTFRVDMNAPVVLHDVRSSWRFQRKEGGGCLYDFASHSIDLVNYLLGPPAEVFGTVLSRIHSDAVEDAVATMFLYESGARGSVQANWSDPAYRKPSCRFEALGRTGKIIADFYSYKAFFRQDPGIDGFTKGWNQGYLADLAEPVRFYVRGFEFTRQLDYFIDCILKQKPCEICSFEDGLKTDLLMDRIRRDGEGRRLKDGQNHTWRQPVLRHQPHVGGKSAVPGGAV
jgi:predicted dehydrogenase